MGQEEVMEFLKTHQGGWYSSKDISKATDRTVSSVTVCLKKLRDRNEIVYKRTRSEGGKIDRYLYTFKT